MLSEQSSEERFILAWRQETKNQAKGNHPDLKVTPKTVFLWNIDF